MSESGIPVEIFLSPGSYPDVSSLYDFTFPLPEGSVVYGDKAYNVYGIEDELKKRNISLMPIRKKTSRRKYDFRWWVKSVDSYFFSRYIVRSL